ncbi:MAG: DUF2953 domain-containing protein [Candidatus Methanoperedens sp.]|nr:DUF2953 domain-containing protein [Candidatus Methanoperedens sp.]
MIAVIVAIPVILAFVMLLLLLLPVTIYINSARSCGKLEGIFGISWAILRIRYLMEEKRIEILISGKRIFRISQKNKLRNTGGQKKPQKKLRIKNIFNLSGPVLRLLKDVVYTFKLKYFDMDVLFGLGDPAYTGIFTGFLHAIMGSLRIGNRIRWTADFTRSELEWKLKARASVIPIRLLPPLTRFIADRHVLRTIKTIYSM